MIWKAGFIFSLLVVMGFAAIPDVELTDSKGEKYDVHEILASGQYIAFYTLSKT